MWRLSTGRGSFGKMVEKCGVAPRSGNGMRHVEVGRKCEAERSEDDDAVVRKWLNVPR